MPPLKKRKVQFLPEPHTAWRPNDPADCGQESNISKQTMPYHVSTGVNNPSSRTSPSPLRVDPASTADGHGSAGSPMKQRKLVRFFDDGD
jgi:hypothetical protein